MLDWASLRGRPELRDATKVPPFDGMDLPVPKPRKSGIALALGGGAARGWAHIGVLRALDEAGIEINMIAGTSIGALVGGCYLAGKLDALEEFARSLTKRRIFGLLDFKLGGNGLFGGMRLTARLHEHLDGLTFADLPKPLVCVAAEIRTGHEIWLSEGSLIDAMRASYALPGVFEPVICNGRVLVDGALVNPVPVSVCRAYEQPLVVAVNLHYDLFGRAAVIKHSADMPKSAAERRKGCPRGRKEPGARVAARRHRRDGGGLQHHPGPHFARPAGRRSARPFAAAQARPYRAHRVLPRRRGDPLRLRGDPGPARRAHPAAGGADLISRRPRHPRS